MASKSKKIKPRRRWHLDPSGGKKSWYKPPRELCKTPAIGFRQV